MEQVELDRVVSRAIETKCLMPNEGAQSHRLGWLGTIEAKFANYVAQWRPGRQRRQEYTCKQNPPNDSPARDNLVDAAAASVFVQVQQQAEC